MGRTQMNTAEIIDLIENRYFGKVAAGRPAEALSCFTPGAPVRIRHGDSAPREFQNGATGQADLSLFYAHLCGEYDVTVSDFWHVVDVDQQRAASTFLVEIEPKPGGRYAGEAKRSLRNCNFFVFEGDLISDMTIYYAAADGQIGGPTGYPPAPA